MPLTTYTAGDVLTAASLNANFTFAAANPTGGVVLITKVSFASQTSVAFANSIFTSTYTRFMVQMSAESTSGDSTCTMQVRDNTSTKSTGNYFGAVLGRAANGNADSISTSSGTSFSMGKAGASFQGFWNFQVSNPTDAAIHTTWAGTGFMRQVDTSFSVGAVFGGTYGVDEAHTGLVFSFSAASTGSYNVYGLADA